MKCSLDFDANVLWIPDCQRTVSLKLGGKGLYVVDIVELLGLDRSPEIAMYGSPCNNEPYLTEASEQPQEEPATVRLKSPFDHGRTADPRLSADGPAGGRVPQHHLHLRADEPTSGDRKHLRMGAIQADRREAQEQALPRSLPPGSRIRTLFAKSPAHLKIPGQLSTKKIVQRQRFDKSCPR